MLLLLQNVLYCLLYVMLIKCAVKNDGLNCLYFYPKEYIEEAEKRGIANKETVMKKSKWFMIPFCVIIFFRFSADFILSPDKKLDACPFDL